MTWLLWLSVLVGVLALTAIGLTLYGANDWAASIRAHTRRLESSRVNGKAGASFPSSYDARELQGLPVPVKRYFSAVLKDGPARLPEPSSSASMKAGTPGWDMTMK